MTDVANAIAVDGASGTAYVTGFTHFPESGQGSGRPDIAERFTRRFCSPSQFRRDDCPFHLSWWYWHGYWPLRRFGSEHCYRFQQEHLRDGMYRFIGLPAREQLLPEALPSREPPTHSSPSSIALVRRWCFRAFTAAATPRNWWHHPRRRNRGRLGRHEHLRHRNDQFDVRTANQECGAKHFRRGHGRRLRCKDYALVAGRA